MTMVCQSIFRSVGSVLRSEIPSPPPCFIRNLELQKRVVLVSLRHTTSGAAEMRHLSPKLCLGDKSIRIWVCNSGVDFHVDAITV